MIDKKNTYFIFFQIGENCVIDPTSEEEMCSPASTIVSIVPNGNITSIIKIGYGSMQDTTLIKMLEVFEKCFINIKMNTILFLMIYYSQNK